MLDALMQNLGLSAFSLKGFGPLLLEGTWMTIKLAVLSLALSILLGLIGASAKLSSSALLRVPAQIYTTLIRGIPDLVLMLLIFYSLQTWLTMLTDAMEWEYIEINPFGAGVITLGFIYGAYFTETFRGAILAIPKGHREAGLALGMSRSRILFKLVLPQMWRIALPGLGNLFMILMKDTALVSVIGLEEIMRHAQIAVGFTKQAFTFYMVAAFMYLGLTVLAMAGMYFLEKRASRGFLRSAS
ncbi:Histidine ABC transporter, permease protein [Pseudomonas amygdali pv. photiniae]|uniref:Histidine ABC transporter, permease protein n=2 Tax=Pseudomonas syringae group genomosp. 2 TaxID=251698 RepID=A0A658KPC4_PSEA0|nr:Histidine ABC transporter, permease protein [Pseudomonas amygdali pv. photiniae]